MPNFNLDIPIASEIVKGVREWADDRKTTPEEQALIDLEHRKLDNEIALGQMRVNEQEAKSPSLFIGGWRPAVGWICAAALGLATIGDYIFTRLWAIAGVIWDFDGSPPPPMSLEVLLPVLLGMLGLGGYRTYEKLKKIDTRTIQELPSIEIIERKRK